MISKKSILVIAALSLSVLPACKSSKKNDSGTVGGNNNPPPAVQQLDLGSITQNNFFALVGFDFSGAVVKKYKLMQGTSFETSVKRFSYFFSKQQLLNNEKLAKNSGSYCELYIESHPKTDGGEIELKEGARLRLGTQSKFVSNSEVSFNLVLQQSFSEQFQLFCVNTLDVEEVNEHIGHILFITKDNKPFPKETKVKKISFFQDSFGFMFSKGSQTVVLNASFAVKDLTKSMHNGVNQVAWRMCDANKGVCISEWQFLNTLSHSGSIGLTMEIFDKKQINQVIKNMRSLEVQLSVDSLDNSGTPRLTHRVDLGSYCDLTPQNFLNSDFNTIGCVP